MNIRGAIKVLLGTEEKAVGQAGDDWVLNGGSLPTSSGARVDAGSAMGLPAVWACVNYISEDVAKVPAIIYKVNHETGEREKARTHPLYKILTRSPNSWQSPFEYIQYVQSSLLLQGNAYSLIIRNGRGAIQELIPIGSNRVTVYEATGGELFYQISGGTNFENSLVEAAQTILSPEGKGVMVPQEHIWHLRGITMGSGVLGMSPISAEREAIGLALSQQEYSGSMVANGARPSMVLQHPEKLSEAAAKRLKKAWDNAYGGASNAAKTAVLEEGMTANPISLTAVDAQFIEQKKYSLRDIARIYRMPPTKLGDMEQATYSNSEQEGLAYLSDTLVSIFERWESSMNRNLLSVKEGNKYVIEFDIRKLLRTDVKARFDSYRVGRQWSIFTPNECRISEGLNPVEDGDELLTPLNMVPLGSELAMGRGEGDDPDNPDDPDDPDTDPDNDPDRPEGGSDGVPGGTSEGS